MCCRVNPTVELKFDGTTLHPYDAMFVKMKRAMVQANTPAVVNALRYQHWMANSVRELFECCVMAALDPTGSVCMFKHCSVID